MYSRQGKSSIVVERNAMIHHNIFFKLVIYFEYLRMLFHLINSPALKSGNKKPAARVNEIL
jgi:hypothetical protein